MGEKDIGLIRELKQDVMPGDRILHIPEQRQAYCTHLIEMQSTPDPFPLSHTEKNPDIDPKISSQEIEERYAQALSPYQIPKDKVRKDKIDFLNSASTGHKFHLNIAIKDVRQVSEYLTEEGFFHKYLNSGEAFTGSMFTIYVGSKDLADQLSVKISQDLDSVLKRPVSKSEIEYAPNVIGRFTVADEVDKFTHYGFGVRGFPMLKKYASQQMLRRVKGLQNKLADDQFKTAFDESYAVLSDLYGSYFYGKGK
jgi:hypothetical protein